MDMSVLWIGQQSEGLSKTDEESVNAKDYFGNTPLMHAVTRSEPMTSYLLKNGAEKSINATNKDGRTAWDMAMSGGKTPEVLEMIESYGGKSGKKARTTNNSGPAGYEAQYEWRS